LKRQRQLAVMRHLFIQRHGLMTSP
jgi:hypothetical protein